MLFVVCWLWVVGCWLLTDLLFVRRFLLVVWSLSVVGCCVLCMCWLLAAGLWCVDSCVLSFFLFVVGAGLCIGSCMLFVVCGVVGYWLLFVASWLSVNRC